MDTLPMFSEPQFTHLKRGVGGGKGCVRINLVLIQLLAHAAGFTVTMIAVSHYL